VLFDRLCTCNLSIILCMVLLETDFYCLCNGLHAWDLFMGGWRACMCVCVPVCLRAHMLVNTLWSGFSLTCWILCVHGNGWTTYLRLRDAVQLYTVAILCWLSVLNVKDCYMLDSWVWWRTVRHHKAITFWILSTCYCVVILICCILCRFCYFLPISPTVQYLILFRM
jgi:hypothetical protein